MSAVAVLGAVAVGQLSPPGVWSDGSRRLPAPVAATAAEDSGAPYTAHRGSDGHGGRAPALPAPPEEPGPRAWPVTGTSAGRPQLLGAWRPPPSPYAAGHRGVDLAARPGQPVRAAAAGRVSFAGSVAGRGVVSVELSGTGTPPLRVTYQPVVPEVREGERVAAGERVGVLGPGPYHCASGCLHWGLLRGARYLDPLSLLPPWMLLGSPPRLLPVYGVPEPSSAEPTDEVAGSGAPPSGSGPAP